MYVRFHTLSLFVMTGLLLNACADHLQPAPVVDVNTLPQATPIKHSRNVVSNHKPPPSPPSLSFYFNDISANDFFIGEQNLQGFWPAEGKIIHPFSASNKGIDIAGKEGSPIYAMASGKVVYAGDGLRGYGNLVLIRHNNLYLSAYAHNKKVLVQEGQIVQKGQKIAEMGHTGTSLTMLHFEIRKGSEAIDPVRVLRNSSFS